MKAKPSISFNIPRPCHEDWSKMTEVDKGRFCNACRKEVTDFTVLTDQEILLFFKKAGTAPVCGHARADQLNRPFYLPATRTRSLPRTLTAHLAASFLFLQAFFGPATVWGSPRYKQEISTPEPAVGKSAVIKGKVIDYASHKPVTGITIIIPGTDLKAVTDKKGSFTFMLPADFTIDSITLHAQHTDSASITSHSIFDEQIGLYSLAAHQEIVLYQYPIEQREDVLIENYKIPLVAKHGTDCTFITGSLATAPVKRSSFWQRLNRKLKRR
jgi:hypothetical protein